MAATYFVTGTDTGVGKTTISAGLLAAARRLGHRVAALKPAESGGDPGSVHTTDAARLAAAAGLDVPAEQLAPFRYALPVAPAVAARRERRPFDLTAFAALVDAWRSSTPDLFLIEGAGGLLVPYGDNILGADLAAHLGLPLLIVARASLGTINHTLLPIFEARRRGLDVAGVILSRVLEARAPDEDDNAAEIARLGKVEVLGTVAHLPLATRRDPTALADAVLAAVDVSALIAQQPTPA